MSLLPTATFANPDTTYFEPAGNIIRASGNNNPTNTAELFSYNPDVTGILLNSNAGGGQAVQLQITNDASTGLAVFNSTVTPGASSTAFSIGTNQAATGITNGRVIFQISPQVGVNLPMTIPFSQNGAWAGGNNTTYSITITPTTQQIFSRPNILVKSQYTSRNNDAANQVNVIPSVQVPTFPAQTGPQLTVGNSGQDSFCHIADFVLVQGVHYSSASTNITLSYVIGGTAGSGVYAFTCLGMS